MFLKDKLKRIKGEGGGICNFFHKRLENHRKAVREFLEPAGKKSYATIEDEFSDLKDKSEPLLIALLEDVATWQGIESKESLATAVSHLSYKVNFIDLVYILNGENGDLLEFDQTEEHNWEEQDLLEDGVLVKGPYFIPTSSGRKEEVLASLKEEEKLNKKGIFNRNRKNRPYYYYKRDDRKNGAIVVTKGYPSACTRLPCISASVEIKNTGKILVVDADISALVDHFRGEHKLQKIEPLYKKGMVGILGALFLIGAGMFIGGIFDLLEALTHVFKRSYATNFLNVLVTFTVILAIADLLKTLFEEEVIFYKDILRPTPARRTVIRFMTAILIALSIETMVLVFKYSHPKKEASNFSEDYALGESETSNLNNQPLNLSLDPESMMYGITALLVGLAIYIFLTGYLEHITARKPPDPMFEPEEAVGGKQSYKQEVFKGRKA